MRHTNLPTPLVTVNNWFQYFNCLICERIGSSIVKKASNYNIAYIVNITDISNSLCSSWRLSYNDSDMHLICTNN